MSDKAVKFKFIKKVDGEVAGYQGKTHKTGDVVEFTGPFIEKAKKNPNYELVQEVAKETLTVKNAK